MGCRIVYNLDDVNGATIVASSTYNSDFPAGNVINDFVNRPWRSNPPITNPEYVSFDMGSAKSMTCAGIVGHNFSSGATVKLQRSPDNSVWTDVGTFTILLDADGNVLKRVVLFFSSISYRYWRIHIVDTSNPAGYVEMGRVIIGDYYEPSRNYNDYFAIEYIDPSEEQRAAGRDPIYRQQTIYRRATVSFEYMDDTQRNKFIAMFLKVGNTKPMLLALDPTDAPSQESMYCSFLTPMRLLTALINQHDALNVVFEERT